MDLSLLKRITDLKYQKSLAGLSDLLAREATLRAEISRLRTLAFETQSLPVSANGIQNIGADVIWLKWIDAKTRQLNMELAQVLANKEALATQQKRALGRKTVAQDLATNAQQAARKERAKLSLADAVSVDQMRRSGDQ